MHEAAAGCSRNTGSRSPSPYFSFPRQARIVHDFAALAIDSFIIVVTWMRMMASIDPTQPTRPDPLVATAGGRALSVPCALAPCRRQSGVCLGRVVVTTYLGTLARYSRKSGGQLFPLRGTDTATLISRQGQAVPCPGRRGVWAARARGPPPGPPISRLGVQLGRGHSDPPPARGAPGPSRENSSFFFLLVGAGDAATRFVTQSSPQSLVTSGLACWWMLLAASSGSQPLYQYTFGKATRMLSALAKETTSRARSS